MGFAFRRRGTVAVRAAAAAIETEATEGGLPLRQMLVKQALPLLVLAALLPFLLPYFQTLDLASAAAQVAQLPVLHWAAAAAMTAISLFAVARYDAAIHRLLRLSPGGLDAIRAGVTAIAIAQTTGFGLIMGTLVRWRMLPWASLPQALAINAAVSGCFVVGWAMFTAFVVLALPHDLPAARAIAWGVLLGGLVLFALGFWAPRVGGLHLRLPPLPLVAALLGWIALDLTAAAMAFRVLLPPGAEVSFAVLLPVFLLATAAGMFGGTPAGIGPFEVTLLALLPLYPEAAFLCAIIAFRVIYYALPAVIAAAVLAIGPGRREKARKTLCHPTGTEIQQAVTNGAPAEYGVIHQGLHGLLPMRKCVWLIKDTPNMLVGLLDPCDGAGKGEIAALHRAAKEQGRLPALYKCSARLAAQARKMGYSCLRIASEAVVDLQSFDLAAPSHRQLRRKLRRAEKAGVTVQAAGPKHMQALTDLDAIWQGNHGAAHGFSMGRFTPDYVHQQAVFVAHRADQPLGFVSFHTGTSGWTLDLMRHVPDLPDGTMHLLVTEGLIAAQAAGVPMASLAAVPAGQLSSTKWANPAAGLTQFKASFAPKWQPRYLAAPNRLALCLAAWDIWRAIHWPDPLPGPTAPTSIWLKKIMKIINLPHDPPCGIAEASSSTGAPHDKSALPSSERPRLASG